MIRILIVEDDRDIARLIKIALDNAGYSADIACDGAEGADMLERKSYNLVLLDIMMPNVDGFELFSYIKEYKTPVIFITARGGIEDKTKAFRMGADDFLVKPFEIEELILRVENVLRHYGYADSNFTIKNLEVNVAKRMVKKDGVEVPLTYKEFDLLILLYHNRNAALNRYVMYDKIWGDEQTDNSRTLDIHIRRLRQKLDLDNEIKTVFKVGYMLKTEED